MANFVIAQGKTNNNLRQFVDSLTSKVDCLVSHNKMIETQIGQLAQKVHEMTKPQGQPPGQPEANPRGHVNSIVVIDGRQFGESDVVMRSGEEGTNGKSHDRDIGKQDEKSIRRNVEGNPIEGEAMLPPTNPYVPQLPYPQRVAQLKLEIKYRKFVGMLEKLYVHVPSLNTITEVPSFVQFL